MVSCTNTDGLMPFWRDVNCRAFVRCENKIPYMHTCPVGMAFSLRLNDCVEWQRVNCNAQNKALFLAVETAALVKQSHNLRHTFSRGEQAASEPRPMIDTRRLGQSPRELDLARVLSLQEMLRKKIPHLPQFSDVIPVVLPKHACNREGKVFDPVVSRALLNAVLLSETGCADKARECGIPFLDIICNDDADDSDGDDDEDDYYRNFQHHHAHQIHDEDSDDGDDYNDNETDATIGGDKEKNTKPYDKENDSVDVWHYRDGAAEMDTKYEDSSESKAFVTEDKTTSRKRTLADRFADGNEFEDKEPADLDIAKVDQFSESKSRFTAWSTTLGSGFNFEDNQIDMLFPSKSDLPTSTLKDNVNSRRTDSGRSQERVNEYEDYDNERKEERFVSSKSNWDATDLIEQKIREAVDSRLGKI
ncbi:hypothetical protein PoB_001297000 [Plakobranchus ocellatus]|uniref:Chitin-binding type-2 domain-containing protein n=1 Tax=Plakobranchus ocellatus TaxID=259542 RepID=A0AAV3YTF3_9GAST|nr:hypothetical protein PoB_001297000 [Plakobranchus ocellatus]